MAGWPDRLTIRRRRPG